MEQFSRLMSEADFFKDMMSNEDMTKDGKLTDYGVASLGLYAQNYESYLAQAEYYGEEIKRVQAMLADDKYNTELIAQLQEYEDAQRSALSATKEQEQAMVELVKEGYQSLIDSLSETADKYKEVLRNAKDANDYQNTISEKTESADALRKQIAAYENMTGNEEIASKLQKANKELKEIEKDIQETMYDKYISDTENALDEMVNEIETFIEELDFNTMLSDAMKTVEGNTDTINSTLNGLADKYEVSMTTAMQSIWTNGFTPEKGFNSVISAIDKLIAVSDKQADKVAYNSAKIDYTDTSRYEANVRQASATVDELSSAKKSKKSDLEQARKEYEEAMNNKHSIEAEHFNLTQMLKEANANLERVRKKFGRDSHEYSSAMSQYEYVSRTLGRTESRLRNANSLVNQRQNKMNNAQVEYDKISAELKDAKAYKSATKAELAEVMASNKSVIETFLKAIVNYDSEIPSGELAKKVAGITNGGVLESHNMSQLAELLGCSNSESDIVQKLKTYGFATGGIVKATGEDGFVLARNGEGFVMPEHVESIRTLLDSVPDINKFVDVAMPKFDQIPVNRNGGGNITIDMGGIVMNEVNDVKTFGDNLANAIQNNKRVQRVLDSHVSSSMLGKNSLLSKRY